MTEKTVLDQLADRAAATRIVRWHDGRVAAGVARGVAARFDLDPVLVRVAFVVATTLGGVGIAAYLLAWVLLPDDRGSTPLTEALRNKSGPAMALVGLTGLIFLGVLLGVGGNNGGLRLLGLFTLVGGGWLLWRKSDGQPSSYEGQAPTSSAQRGAGAPSAGPAGGDPSSASSGAPVTRAAGPAAMPVITPWGGLDGERVSPYATGPSGAMPGAPAGGPGLGGPGAPHPNAYAAAPHAARVATAPRPPKPRRRSLGVRLWLIAIGLSITTYMLARSIATAAGQDQSRVSTIGLAAAALVIGVLLVTVGVRGYRTSGLAPAAVILAVGALLVPMTPAWLNTDGVMGEVTWQATSAADLNRAYEVGLGEGTLNLRTLSSTDLAGKTVDVKVGLGSLVVQVPDDVRTEIRADIGMGSLTVRDLNTPERSWEGAGQRSTIEIGDGPRLILNVEVGLGEAIIERTKR